MFMYECLFFFIGLLIGGVIGVVAMCLFQINRPRGKDDEFEKTKL
jgi:gas vesicle protein